MKQRKAYELLAVLVVLAVVMAVPAWAQSAQKEDPELKRIRDEARKA